MSIPPEIAAGTLPLAALVVLAASVVKSTTGFGFAMVSVPLLLLMWDPIFVVPVVMPLIFTTDFLIVGTNWRMLEPGRVFPMIAAGVVGIPIGTAALVALPADVLTLTIAGIVLLASVALLFGLTIPLTRERLAGGIAGLLSGILGPSTGLSGPPVSLFMINQRWAKHAVRNNLGLFFVFIDTFIMASLGLSGALNGRTLVVSAVLWVPVVVGFAVAVRILPHIQQERFLRLATAVVMASAILATVNVVR